MEGSTKNSFEAMPSVASPFSLPEKQEIAHEDFVLKYPLESFGIGYGHESDTKPDDMEKIERFRDFIEKSLIYKKSEINFQNWNKKAEEIWRGIEEAGLAVRGGQEELMIFMEIALSGVQEEALKGLMDNPQKINERLELYERSSGWMNRIEDDILSKRNNPEDIKEFWKRFCAILDTEQVKMGTDMKYSILAQIAAKDLMLGIEGILKNKIGKGQKYKIKIIDATPEEDVLKSVDFWIELSAKAGTKKVPCQVKHLNVECNTKNKLRYLESNMVNCGYPVGNESLEYDYPQERALFRFFDMHSEGIFIILPQYRDQTIFDDGGVNKDILNKFQKDIASQKRFSSIFTSFV
jgi:hypothetical protein